MKARTTIAVILEQLSKMLSAHQHAMAPPRLAGSVKIKIDSWSDMTGGAIAFAAKDLQSRLLFSGEGVAVTVDDRSMSRPHAGDSDANHVRSICLCVVSRRRCGLKCSPRAGTCAVSGEIDRQR